MTVGEEQKGAADQLLDVVLSSGAHLWHNRPGLDVGGRWVPRTNRAAARVRGAVVAPGLFVPAAVDLYGSLLAIYELDAELMARFAGYAMTETDWRDLKVACAALMLVQPRAGQPVREPDGSVAFFEDDFRAVGEAMVLHYEKGSSRMLNPKGILRIAQLLEVPDIAELNRAAGFADPAGRKPPLGRWSRAVHQWLEIRERNLRLLEGLVDAGFKETIKKLARKSGYKPETPQFFELLGWPQKQSAAGHRTVGLDGLDLRRAERFDGLTEAEICERIVTQKLSYKDAVGRLPAGLGLTPAIMAALLPSLSDRDLRIMTPTLESLGLLADADVRARWERALQTADDQRALNIARNVRSTELRDRLEASADVAARRAVEAAQADKPIEVMFLIDKSGSMSGAIEQSKEALTRILAGFPPERLHIAIFDTLGRVLRPKAPTRAAVAYMLSSFGAGGGTTHASAVAAFAREGIRTDPNADLIVIVVGDEAGEVGSHFADSFAQAGYRPSALALILNVAGIRGRTVREAAAHLRVPFTEVAVDQFDDPYQVTRVLRTILEAPLAEMPGVVTSRWIEKVLATPLLVKPV